MYLRKVFFFFIYNIDRLINPKITIVTICRDSERTIEECIQSVIGQTYKNKEYLIIDGGSSDSTLKIIKNYRNSINELLLGPDEGISDAFNKGISKASGDWIIFLNSDDYFVNSTAIENIIEYLNGDICISRVIYEGIRNKFSIKSRYSLMKFKFLVGYAQPGMIFSKSFLKKIGPFSLDYKLAMDTEMLARAIKLNFKVIDIPVSMTVMRLGGISSKYTSEVIKEGTQIRAKYFGYFYAFIYKLIRNFFSKIKYFFF